MAASCAAIPSTSAELRREVEARNGRARYVRLAVQRLDIQALQRLGGLKLRARAVVEGVLSGLHKSPHQGQSVEFAEHKEYTPGDELRHIDWKAYGKFDRYYVKRFEHETNLRATLVVDASGSMAFTSIGATKLDVATTLASALAFLLIRQQDAAGLTLLSGAKTVDIPPRSAASHHSVLLKALESARPTGTTDLGACANHLAEALPRRSLVCVFSDLFDDHPHAVAELLALAARKHDLALFHLVDPAELNFPWDDACLFTSMEDARSVEVQPREIRESYLEEFGAFLRRTKEACASANCHYDLVRTDEPLDQVLLRFLSQRDGRR